ncbi:hypothetical protein H0H87_011094 [Tephrocybe sp. NHM501043]|nr:hypothetical protein H0H87_011094 [Tephrocybe sp. NHM501043]
MPTHRKRVSVLRLSSDTTHSLPVYAATNSADDRPPDYPDSAEEADADTDSSTDSQVCVLPPPPPPSASFSPRRRRFTHRRRTSAAPSDPYLDSLLARSVHALEMSNTLLQSSMSTQTALSTIFADSPADEVLESSARGLSKRIAGRDTALQPKWADDLAEISRGVDGLFADEPAASPGASVSCSLPTSSSPIKQLSSTHRRRPSLGHTAHLHLAAQGREDLVAPPPRAMTQYVGSTSDPNAIYLPSTLGARASASTSSLTLNLHAPLSEPRLTDQPHEPATPAYAMLVSLVHRPSASSSASSTPSVRSSPLPHRRQKSPVQTRDSTPKQIPTALPHHRPMTPPTEESSSSSSDACPAKRTVASLRKILDEQPPPPPPKRLQAPKFLPRSPPPVAAAATSTATASISRLYTKNKHTASTRAASPPPRTAMKQSSPTSSSPPAIARSASNGPSPSPTVLSIPDLLSVRSWSGSLGRSSGSSAPSSGRSTPKRISFAQLPESYADSRGGSSAKFRERDKSKRRKGAGARKGGAANGKDNSEGEGGGSWWSGWLLAGAAIGQGGHGYGKGEERMEERLSRSWGGKMPGAAGFGPGMDEWTI